MLHERAGHVVYLVRPENPAERSVLKVLTADWAAGRRAEMLSNEFDILQSLKVDGVIKALKLGRVKGRQAIQMQWFDGASLKARTKEGAFEAATFLPIAIRLAEILGGVHGAHVIHRDISSSNVLLSSTNEVCLIDFNLASRISVKSEQLDESLWLEGNLSYISPEQTGRVNRHVDHRTDLYSLGVVFYEMLTGQLPFKASEPLEQIYAHLALAPPAMSNVPEPLAQVVQKLLAKNAEDRYQSAAGLTADLEQCLAGLQQNGSISPFEIGRHDVYSRLHAPGKLYGRKAEVEQLLAALQKAASGRKAMAHISGHSGTGKSTLVHELARPVAASRGFFISGKFDQGSANSPYAGIALAFGQFVDLLLMEPEAELQRWKKRLGDAVAGLGRVLVEVIPALERILGPQPEVPSVGISEAQNRFNYAFLSLVRGITESKRPLVLFVDDLQWADPASLHLLKALMLDSALGQFLLVASYRSNEVPLGHPVAVFISELEIANVEAEAISLTDLSAEAVGELLSELLNAPVGEVEPLAEIVYNKTHGNPFFVHQFVRNLHERGLLQFDFSRARWRWSAASIRSQHITDNVLELLQAEVTQLAPETQRLLHIAALLGSTFDLALLQKISGLQAAEVQHRLQPAFAAQMLVDAGSKYRFIHDRVRQTVRELVAEPAAANLHLSIGRALLENLTDDASSSYLFKVVNHLNKAVELVGLSERTSWAELNLKAGSHALEAAAFSAALQYFEQAISLDGSTQWRTRYKQALAMHNGAAEAAFMCGQYEKMDGYIDTVVEKAQELAHTTTVTVVRIKALQAQGNLLESVRHGMATLRQHGVRFPKAPGNANIIGGLLRTRQALAGKSPEKILAQPEMTDAHALAVTEIMANLVAASYLSLPKLLPLLFFRQINLSLKHGISPDSATAYVGYGTILCAMGDFEGGQRYANLALKLVERPGAEKFRCKIIYGAHALVVPWKQHVREVLDPLAAAYRFGLEAGDHENTAYSIVARYGYMYMAGVSLPRISRELKSYMPELLEMQFDNPINFAHIHLQAAHALQNHTQPGKAFEGPHYHESKMVAAYREQKDFNILGLFYTHKLMVAVRLRRFGEAMQAVEEMKTYAAALTANPLLINLYTYGALAAANSVGTAAGMSQSRTVRRVKKNLKKLAKWAKASPENVAHKVALVTAEYHRITNNHVRAGQFYSKAVELAAEGGFVHEQALALELQARWMHSEEKPEAQQVMSNALSLCREWGAPALVDMLLEEWPEWFESTEPIQPSEPGTEASTFSYNPQQLDLESILKASNAISAQLTLDGLLARLIAIVMENAGAQRGYLLMQHENEWRVVAAGEIHDGQLLVQRVDVSAKQQDERLAWSMVNFVSRTKKPLVLEDAASDATYWNDPHVQQAQPRSVLCSPFARQGSLVGIVYLENNSAAGAFGPERLSLLNLLSAQAAISLENARLYSNMEELVTAYERFVPKQFLNHLEKDRITQVQLGDQVQREMTVMFSDIRNFTSLSEQMSPAENFAFLNRYLGRMEPVITRHYGFIDKYIGDAIMGLFPSNADDALQCAIAMLRELEEFNREQSTPINIGIGLNTGNLMLGTIGGNQRMDGTVISDAVNLTARVEGMTKSYGANLIITQNTLQRLENPENYLIRKLDNVIAKGKTHSVLIYQVCDALPEEVRALVAATKSVFERGVDCFHKADFEQAHRLFEGIVRQNPHDACAQFFVARCKQFLSLEGS